MAVLVLPVAAVIAFFSFDILLLWTGSTKTASVASPIVSVLVIGMALNALMTLPYALQLSHGWTSKRLLPKTEKWELKVIALADPLHLTPPSPRIASER